MSATVLENHLWISGRHAHPHLVVQKYFVRHFECQRVASVRVDPELVALLASADGIGGRPFDLKAELEVSADLAVTRLAALT